MKHKLEKWRELILVMHSVLLWEQKFYPGVIVAAVSAVFLFLWYMDLTFVTCSALIALALTLFDYFYPRLAKMIFKPDKWRGVEEKRYEEVVEQLFRLKNRFTTFVHFVASAKNDKSTLFILATSTVCVILAWVGSTINNQLLAFLVSLLVLLFPGAQHKGYFGVVERFVVSRFKLGTPVVGDVKKDN